MAVCYIVGAAAYCAPFATQAGDFVIAADGGLLHMQERGMTPDLIVGDFDSLAAPPTAGEVVTFPVEKDDTDTMLAIKLAWERGYREFRLMAGTGGRSDHTLANLQALLWVARRGGRAVLCGEGECFTALCGGALRFAATAAGTLSVFAQGGDACEVTLKGVYYPLQNGTLTADFPLGVSNRFIGAEATLQVGDGAVLVYWTGTADEVTFDE